jgi:hypothetical protein
VVTAKQRFGTPENESNMMILTVPPELDLHYVPKRIYCNKDIYKPLLQAFHNIAESRLQDEVKTWDGCFNIRKKKASSTASLHSWGYAIDINAAWNRYGYAPTMQMSLVRCFESAGFEWGGHWKTPDGMHFQLRELRELRELK